ncbi:DUF1775 domain-containing protein [Krasilnikovia sp. M28-CT-15]|uniref:DUF1775 domain-containing protein n=1 Tax=Krasilnikovia sp. M28-CT-15 TaxID=3373540 RepID=UPI003875B5C1
MSRLLDTRRAGILVAAATAGVLCTAGPAAADVTVSPGSVPQGSGQNLTFHVTNPGGKQITTVRLVLPPDTPVAEVYPLSDDDWAPRIDNRHLDTPLKTIHGGTPVTETAAAITWIAMGGKSIAPGKAADLAVALGPLPTLSSMRFTVQGTYADGTPVPATSADLKLTPLAPGEAPAAHPGHGGGATDPGQNSAGADDAAFAAVVSRAEQGPSFWSIAGWVVAVLAGAGAVLAVRRSRRRPGDADGPATRDSTADAAAPDGAAPKGTTADGTAKAEADGGAAAEGAAKAEAANEPVGAGTSRARVTGWSYRDGP